VHRTEPNCNQEAIVKHPLALGAAATAVVVLLAGCGSSSNSSSSSSAASTPSTAAPSTPAPATTTATSTATGGELISSKRDKLGTILAAGPKKLTVYLFEGDKGAASSCTGACAKTWPPVTTSSAPTVAGSAVSAEVGTITREDGTKQVTYKGHPLYFFVKDGDVGDAYGQGVSAFGSDWYVLAPSGAKVDES
jgi:predicted lipoprotein with Yx(FWY)xxD motif